MSRYRAYGLCTTVVLLLGASASPAARAAGPEFRHLGLPLTKAVGFNFKGGFGKFLLGTSNLTWSGVSGAGAIEAPNKINGEIVFTGSKIGTCTVHTPGAGAGQVVVKSVKGQLGYLEEATKNVGVLFSKATELFTQVEATACNKAITLAGSVIGKFTPVNSETTSLAASFLVAGGKDTFTKFQGEGAEHVLHYEESGGGEGESAFQCEKEELLTSEGVEVRG